MRLFQHCPKQANKTYVRDSLAHLKSLFSSWSLPCAKSTKSSIKKLLNAASLSALVSYSKKNVLLVKLLWRWSKLKNRSIKIIVPLCAMPRSVSSTSMSWSFPAVSSLKNHSLTAEACFAQAFLLLLES